MRPNCLYRAIHPYLEKSTKTLKKKRLLETVVNLTSLQAAVYIVNRYKGLFFLNKDLIACNMRLQTKPLTQ